jgi:hypothetical protein
MQSFIILAIGVMITVFGTFEYQKYSNTTSADLNKNISSLYSTNFFVYNDMSINYIMSNYDSIYDSSATAGTIVYNSSNNFDYTSKLKNIYSPYYTFTPFFIYKTTYFIYVPSATTSDPNPIPVLYMITSWDDSTQQKKIGQQTAQQTSFSILADIVQKLNDKQYSGDTPMWNLPIVGRNDQVRYGQCSTADVDIFNDVDVATKNNYKTWFCKMYQILQPKGYTLKGYFYITPIFAQN